MIYEQILTYLTAKGWEIKPHPNSRIKLIHSDGTLLFMPASPTHQMYYHFLKESLFPILQIQDQVELHQIFNEIDSIPIPNIHFGYIQSLHDAVLWEINFLPQVKQLQITATPVSPIEIEGFSLEKQPAHLKRVKVILFNPKNITFTQPDSHFDEILTFEMDQNHLLMQTLNIELQCDYDKWSLDYPVFDRKGFLESPLKKEPFDVIFEESPKDFKG